MREPLFRKRRFSFWQALSAVALVGAILLILVEVALPFRTTCGGNSREVVTRVQISTFETALTAFELDTGTLPTGTHGLDALVKDPGIEGWSRPYLLKMQVPKDPWGNSYIYIEHPRRSSYTLYSVGPDGIAGTPDDTRSLGAVMATKNSRSPQPPFIRGATETSSVSSEGGRGEVE